MGSHVMGYDCWQKRSNCALKNVKTTLWKRCCAHQHAAYQRKCCGCGYCERRKVHPGTWNTFSPGTISAILPTRLAS